MVVRGGVGVGECGDVLGVSVSGLGVCACGDGGGVFDPRTDPGGSRMTL